MFKVRLTFFDLFSYIEKREDHKFIKNKAYVQKTKLQIKNENNVLVDILALIKKQAHIQQIKFNNGMLIRVAETHLLCYDGSNCRPANKYRIGDTVRTAENEILYVVSNELETEKKDVYDISINSKTHLYQTPNKLIHHNTFINLATFGHWYKTNKVDSLIVITQNGGLLYHWKKEILLFLNLFKDEDIAIIDNSTKKRPFAEFRDKKVLIIPEHLVADIFYSYSKNADKKKKSKWTRWKNYVDVQKEWNKTSTCLLIDEAHSVKNPKAQKTKALLNHISTFNYRLFLSATPAINGFEDWFYQLFLLDKGILNMHPGAARIFVADAMGKKIGKNFIRNIIAKYNSNRVEQIKEKLKYNVIFKHKSEISEMKTVQIIEPVFFQMPPLQRQLYENVFEEEMMKIEYKKEEVTFRNIYTKFPYALQVIDNPFLLTDKIVQPKVTQILGKWKLEFDPRIIWLDKYIDEQIRVLGNKVIIFDTHPLTLDQLAKRYQDLAPLKLVGGMTAEEKSVAQEKFNKVKDSNYLILCSFQAASTGINLQEGGNIIIMWSLPQDATLYRQALDRTYRINSTKDSIVKLCVIDGTFDVIRYNRNRNRTELNDTFLNKSLSSVKLRQLLEGIL